MAEITMKINIGDDVDTAKLGQWIALGNSLDTQFLSMSLGMTGLQSDTGQQEMLGADTDQDGDEGADADDQATDTMPSADGVTPTPRRRGRRSNAEKAAEAARLAHGTNGATPLPPATPQASGC